MLILICRVLLLLGIYLSQETMDCIAARFNNKEGNLCFDDFLQIVCRLYSIRGASAILSFCIMLYRQTHLLTDWQIQPIDCMTSRLTSWLVDLPTNRSADLLTCPPTGQLTYRLASQPASWLIDLPANRPADSSTCQPTGQLTYWLASQPVSWLIDLPANRPADLMTCQPTGQLTYRPTNQPIDQPTGW